MRHSLSQLLIKGCDLIKFKIFLIHFCIFCSDGVLYSLSQFNVYICLYNLLILNLNCVVAYNFLMIEKADLENIHVRHPKDRLEIIAILNLRSKMDEIDLLVRIADLIVEIKHSRVTNPKIIDIIVGIVVLIPIHEILEVGVETAEAEVVAIFVINLDIIVIHVGTM